MLNAPVDGIALNDKTCGLRIQAEITALEIIREKGSVPPDQSKILLRSNSGLNGHAAVWVT